MLPAYLLAVHVRRARQLHAAPWCVEAVWLDGSTENAPLHLSASLPTQTLEGESAVARIKV